MEVFMDKKQALLLLNRVPQLGPRRCKKLLSLVPDPEAVVSMSSAELARAGVPEKLSRSINETCQKHEVLEKDILFESKLNHHIITMYDEAYPSLLKQIHDPPLLLYAKGKLDALEQTCLAVVGSRKASKYGQDIAFQWCKALSNQCITIVSGLAQGIDGRAHQGVVCVKNKTVAVLGSGIDCIYPKQHARLFTEIQNDGLILSEFPLETRPFAGHFPRRNRIISGLSLATLVIEAAVKSGSLITAEFALDQNRSVMAVPGSIHELGASGCHTLIKQGAVLVTSTQEVLEELCIDSRFGGSCSKELDSPLTGGAGSLTAYIDFEVTSVDEIVTRSSLPVEDVITDLAELELQGQIRAVPGGYIRCML